MLLEASRISETILKQTNSNANKMGITAEAQALLVLSIRYFTRFHWAETETAGPC